jgi:hypothetical protein
MSPVTADRRDGSSQKCGSWPAPSGSSPSSAVAARSRSGGRGDVDAALRRLAGDGVVDGRLEPLR